VVVTAQDGDGLLGLSRHAARHRQPHPDDQRLGVLGWGVGGLEAEGALFGVPVILRIPDVVGVR
jgi:aconitate hydratase